MGARSRARELALQVLFQVDTQPGEERKALDYLIHLEPRGTVDRPFAEKLVEGAVRHLPEIDSAIAAASSNWSLDQMGALERAVLRLATQELLWPGGAPVAVVIDEAVGLAKSLSGEESARFVNGVLGEIARTGSGTPEAAGASSPGR